MKRPDIEAMHERALRGETGDREVLDLIAYVQYLEAWIENLAADAAEPDVQPPVDAAWTKAPDAAQYGLCHDPKCQTPTCLDPILTIHQAVSREYTGPLAIMTYVTKEGLRVLRINGEDFGVFNAKDDDPGALIETALHVAARFSEEGMNLVGDHLWIRRNAIPATAQSLVEIARTMRVTVHPRC